MSAPKLLTIQDVAEQLGVSERYVMDKAAEGEIPSVKLGRLRRFRQVDIDRWLETKAEGRAA